MPDVHALRGKNDPVVSLPEDEAPRTFVFVYDSRESTRMEAVLNVIRTLCAAYAFQGSVGCLPAAENKRLGYDPQ